MRLQETQCQHRGLENFHHCNFPIVSSNLLVELINRNLSDGTATSVIRLGDGEGMILARPTPLDGDLWEWTCRHFGPQITSSQVNQLADLLITVIEFADVVGIRDDIVAVDFHDDHFSLDQEDFLRRFKASFKLRPVDMQMEYKHTLRIARLHQCLSKQYFKESTMFVSAWAHFEMSHSGALVKMLHSQERIGLVSSKRALAGSLEKLMGLKVDHYQVPELYSLAVKSGATLTHFPDQFEITMKGLDVKFPGQLFLVGAGICGKIYCDRIKRLGGIAIDIGAVCDAWINIRSRPAVLKSMYSHFGPGTPDGLQLEYQIDQYL